MTAITEENHKKRKLHEGPEIEIDVSAPEPPSKKALRKAKKAAEKAERTPSETPVETKKDTSNGDGEATTEKQQRSDYGVWIGNLAFSVTKDDLRKFFTSNCSFTDVAITRIHLPKGQVKHGKAQNKGFAYVDFSSSKAVKEAQGLSEQLLSGRRVLIKDAKSFEGRPEKPQQDGQTTNSSTSSGNPPSKRIFVGNLGFDATKEILEEHFGKCGSISHVHIATFQDSGKCKGYAWVEFEDLAAAEAAVRGFVMVDEEEEEADEGSGSESGKRNTSKPKKQRQKRVWVNQLLGRRMRMEFAEDATTRYKKRFGKDGEGKKTSSSEITEVEDGDNSASLDGQSGHEQPARTSAKKGKRDTYDNSRYSKETVQKLSGAIVESQGKKITFD